MSDCFFIRELSECIRIDMQLVDCKMHELEQILGYQFKDIRNLANAMCGMKIQRDHSGINAKDLYNDSLATVGDTVIKLILSEKLFKKGCYKGDITEIKKVLESNENLFRLSNEIGLSDYVFNECCFYPEANKENMPPYSKHNQYLEAIVAAVFYDSDYETCKKWLTERFFTDAYLDEVIDNYHIHQKVLFGHNYP